MPEPAPHLPTEERRDRIRELVEERSFVRVVDLSEAFGVSTVTVRTDLEALEHGGAVRRIRGGAMPAEGLRERPFEEVQVDAAPQKEAIARLAVDELSSGMSVLLDVGTTTAAIAAELVRRTELVDLTVITNGLSIALTLEPALPRLQVIVTGGTLRPLQHSLVPPLADTVLSRIRADVAFIGCNGVDVEAGITNINLPEAELKRAMIDAASRVVVAADSSKLGRVHLGRVADLGQVDALVTDGDQSGPALDAIQAVTGLEVLVARGGTR
ncbi:DeoR/GlpR transcriptional regulator [Nocardioides sp. KC13]|uniref:DeoR/GlpR transcriptional regulator n=1 Tax=Nocardioides turkmenicus TaxID=2711220 RepID=A0A6M1RGB8_9ACTN|nr:DeoR/GlpR family DNA-binding transcription regulator [Nocardioides sp. KC13]NGN95297.1 DeoR/GlpR transcriptional regulator [Nocardioides sp. KC13]